MRRKPVRPRPSLPQSVPRSTLSLNKLHTDARNLPHREGENRNALSASIVRASTVEYDVSTTASAPGYPPLDASLDAIQERRARQQQRPGPSGSFDREGVGATAATAEGRRPMVSRVSQAAAGNEGSAMPRDAGQRGGGARQLIAGLRVSEKDKALLAVVRPYFPEADTEGELAERLWRRGLEMTLANALGVGVARPHDSSEAVVGLGGKEFL